MIAERKSGELKIKITKTEGQTYVILEADDGSHFFLKHREALAVHEMIEEHLIKR